ncbi:MAG: Stp1/IreP family PP2C-type Ser/Thr phosphatase [Halofilum sp. (in: g-proteobacteria)]
MCRTGGQGLIGMASRDIDLSTMIAFADRSDTGRKRPHNEDRVAALPARGLAVLADGMGGHRGGEIASALAVDTVIRELTSRLPGIAMESPDDEAYTPESLLVRDVVNESNTIVYETAHTQPQYEGMGTTLVVALFYDDRVTLAHVGDSRAYRLRDGRLDLLTRDHTLMQELIDRGFYTPEEARASLNRNIITRALGTEESVNADLQEEIALPGDIYLLCSDGLNDMVDDETIRLTLDEFGDNLEATADRLIDAANANGGQDNVSVVLARVLRPFPTRRSWFRRFVDWFQ